MKEHNANNLNHKFSQWASEHPVASAPAMLGIGLVATAIIVGITVLAIKFVLPLMDAAINSIL